MNNPKNATDSSDSPDVDEMTSIEMLADYECPECGPVEDVDLTEDEATAVFAGDENGNLICPNDWCDEELGLTAEAALANMKWLVERLPHLAPRFVDEIEGRSMTSAETSCVCGVRLTWPQPFGVVGWLWRADMGARAKTHADCAEHSVPTYMRDTMTPEQRTELSQWAGSGEPQ